MDALILVPNSDFGPTSHRRPRPGAPRRRAARTGAGTVAECAVRRDVIRRHPEHDGPGCLHGRPGITEVARLGGASGRVVFRIEVEHHWRAAQIRQRHAATVRRWQCEIWSHRTGSKHPYLSGVRERGSGKPAARPRVGAPDVRPARARHDREFQGVLTIFRCRFSRNAVDHADGAGRWDDERSCRQRIAAAATHATSPAGTMPRRRAAPSHGVTRKSAVPPVQGATNRSTTTTLSADAAR